METRARKRQRMMFRNPISSADHSGPRKRTFHEAEKPITNRKRRRSSSVDLQENGENQPIKNKRFCTERKSTDADAEMSDYAPNETRRPRPKKRLRDILRQERVSRAVLRELQLNYMRTRATQEKQQQRDQEQQNRAAQHNRRSSGDNQFDHTHQFTGEEEVCEVETIDVSETTEGQQRQRKAEGYYPGAEESPANEGTKPSVDAVLLEDGRCAVQIVRTDGSMQRVIIQPPQWHDY